MRLNKHSMRRLLFCVVTGVLALGLTIQNGYAQGGALPVGDIYALAIDPSTPATLYAGSGEVFKSSNAGTNWTAVSTGLTTPYVLALAIDSANPATLYAGTGSGVFKSINGGASWSVSNTGLTDTHVNALALDPANSATLYAGTQVGGVFKSINGGASWSYMGLTDTDVRALAIDPSNTAILYAGTNRRGVFKSSDGGANWTASNTGLTRTIVSALVIDRGNPTTLYAGTLGGGVCKSINGGANWSASNTGLTNIANNGVVALAIDPATPATLYAGTQIGGVFKSINGGANWSASNTGLTRTLVPALVIDPFSPTTLYAGTYGGGVFKSIDGAATWQTTGASSGGGPQPPPQVPQGSLVNNASFAPHPAPIAPGTIIAIFGTNLTKDNAILDDTALGPDGKIVTTLGGASVKINAIAAPMLRAYPGQLVVQMPVELTNVTSAQVAVSVEGQSQSSTPQTFFVDALSPGIFTVGAGQGAILNGADLNQGIKSLAAAVGSFPNARPARPGETVVIFCTGLGRVNDPVPTGVLPSGLHTTVEPTTVTIDGLPVVPDYAGLAPGNAGLYQVNVRIPSGTRLGNNIAVALSIGGKQSNPVSIAVQ